MHLRGILDYRNRPDHLDNWPASPLAGPLVSLRIRV